MKVVLFCGGMGMRLREYSEAIPKPMVSIGYRPILWHIMKYYASFGHKDFILCLGYKADMIKNYFRNYDEYLSNDFTLSEGGKKIQLLSSDIDDWNITFVDTGLTSNIGQRLRAVKGHLRGEETFLANYSDGLSDLYLPDQIEYFQQQDTIGCFLCVPPSQTFHVVDMHEDGKVMGLRDIRQSGTYVNGGYFIFKNEIFDYIERGDELIDAPFSRLIERQQLSGYRYDGFWTCMDTFKEKQTLDDMYARGEVPWEVWRQPARALAG